jgi:hypothetical protein
MLYLITNNGVEPAVKELINIYCIWPEVWADSNSAGLGIIYCGY